MKAKIESLGTLRNPCGIDISSANFSACFLIDGKPYYNDFSQTLEGYSAFLNTYIMFGCDGVGFESTGVYHKKLQKFLVEHGYSPYILSPRSVHFYLKSQKRILGKTDKSDSYGIALYLMKNDDCSNLLYPLRDAMRPYITAINLCEKQIRQSKNLLHSLQKTDCNPLLPSTYEMAPSVLESCRDSIRTQAINDLYGFVPEARIIKNEIKGVGDILLLNVIPMIYDNLDKFTERQWVSFFGIAPLQFQSGTSVFKNPHISHHGDNSARRALFMASVSAVRNNEIIRSKFRRLVEAGKPKKKALVSIMSHLLRLIISRLAFYTGRKVKR